VSAVWIVYVVTNTKTPVGRHAKPGDEPIAVAGGRFDAAGTGVYFASNEGTEFQVLRHVRIGETNSTKLTEDIPWDVKGIEVSKDRKTIAFTSNEDGTSKLFVAEAGAKKRREIRVPFGTVSNLQFSDDGKSLAFTMNQPSSPADVWTADVSSGALQRWTESEIGGLDPAAFRTSTIVRIPTFDEEAPGVQRTFPAFVYKPAGEGPFPVIVNIHGGPESQSAAIFSAPAQYSTIELGCAVIYPNVRGSSGYGKSYLRMDDGRKREDSVKDIGALLDWIAQQPDLDAGRIGVIGGSYGGYMSLACLARYGNRFRAGVASVGISNFVTFLTNTSEYRRDLRRAEYGDERDPEMRKFLESISPTSHADRIDAPLFVIQGANDPRVPASESEQIVRAVRESGNPAWFMLAKDEGHGFAKRANKDHMEHAISLFWESYLLGEAKREGTE
jgi:dipeptidyl aminopeptidase/acylaminoacyl peptidase